MAQRKQSEGPPPPLHELETEVMQEMWRRDEATVRDVLEALNRGRKKERAYTTVLTIMARLDRKGLLTRRRVGKTDVYAPTLSQEDYLDARARAEVETLLDEFGDLALAHFARAVDQLDPERVKALRALAERD
jgi:predicted transcriptional regulator